MPLTPEFLTGTTPSRPLGVFRAAVGLAACVKSVDLAALVIAGKGTTAGHRGLWLVLVLVWAPAAAALLVGYRTRWAATAIAVLVAVFIRAGDLYSNHFYLLGTFTLLLSVADSGAAFAVDARRHGHRESVPAWPVRLIQFQVSTVYFFSALGKVNADFLAGNVVYYQVRHSVLLPQIGVTSVPLLVALSCGAVLVELFIAVGLWLPALRRWAFPLGLLLHVGMIVTISTSLAILVRLAIFALLVLSAYVLFMAVPPGALVLEEGGGHEVRWLRWLSRLTRLSAREKGRQA